MIALIINQIPSLEKRYLPAVRSYRSDFVFLLKIFHRDNATTAISSDYLDTEGIVVFFFLSDLNKQAKIICSISWFCICYQVQFFFLIIILVYSAFVELYRLGRRKEMPGLS